MSDWKPSRSVERCPPGLSGKKARPWSFGSSTATGSYVRCRAMPINRRRLLCRSNQALTGWWLVRLRVRRRVEARTATPSRRPASGPSKSPADRSNWSSWCLTPTVASSRRRPPLRAALLWRSFRDVEPGLTEGLDDVVGEQCARVALHSPVPHRISDRLSHREASRSPQHPRGSPGHRCSRPTPIAG